MLLAVIIAVLIIAVAISIGKATEKTVNRFLGDDD